jgi:hypothetical protein
MQIVTKEIVNVAKLAIDSGDFSHNSNIHISTNGEFMATYRNFVMKVIKTDIKPNKNIKFRAKNFVSFCNNNENCFIDIMEESIVLSGERGTLYIETEESDVPTKLKEIIPRKRQEVFRVDLKLLKKLISHVSNDGIANFYVDKEKHDKFLLTILSNSIEEDMYIMTL